MERFGSGWSEPLYTVSTVGWEPTVRALEINELQCLVVTPTSVTNWPVPAKEYGLTFDVAARVGGRDTSVLMRIFDQGRSVAGRVHGFGFGIKVASAMPGTTGCAKPLPEGVRLLPFCIVAKVPACNNDQLVAVYAELRRLGIGSGNYERWESSSGATFFVYDVDRNLGYLVNTPGTIKGAKPNLKIVLPQADSWVAWVNSKKKIKSGDHLWLSYGRGSDHHRIIREANELRAERSPTVNAKKRARDGRMAAMREAKAAKRIEPAAPGEEGGSV